MTVQRYHSFGDIAEDPEGGFVSYENYRSLVENYEAMCRQAKAAWQEQELATNFLLSRENDRLKEKIREAGLGVVYQD